jgi:hypothetical protein
MRELVTLKRGSYTSPELQNLDPSPEELVLFLFLHFSILFFTKIYFCFRNLHIYTPASPLPAAGTWSPGCRAAGGFLQFSTVKIYAPAPGGPVARQRGSRPAPPPLFGDIFFTGNDNHAVLCGS